MLVTTGTISFTGRITLFLEVLDWGFVTELLTEGSDDYGLITQSVTATDNFGLITE